MQINPAEVFIPTIRMAFVGFMVSLIGPAVIMPFYMAWSTPHTSATIHNSSSGNSNSKDKRSQHHHADHYRYAASEHALLVGDLGSATLLGYTLATFPMFLPAPDVVSYEFKQLAILWFLAGWPFCIASMAWIISPLRRFREDGFINRLNALISNPRSICFLAIASTSVPLIEHMVYILATTIWAFEPLDLQDYYVFGIPMFVPQLPWSNAKHAAHVAALFPLFQWDYLLTAVSTFIWSISLYIQTHQQAKLSINYTSFVLRVLGLTTISGLGGTAAVLMWERNEILDKMSLTESKNK
jgi:hypothetical protein